VNREAEAARAGGPARRWDAAVILAGGESRRMGEEKALLPAGGETLIERLACRLAPRFQLLMFSLRHEGASVALLQALGRVADATCLPLMGVADAHADLGPLEGVRTALAALPVPRAFFIAVDLPEVHFPLVEVLWERCEAGALGCMPGWRRGPEPACAVYSRALLPAVEEMLASGPRSLQGLAGLEGVAVLDLEDEAVSGRIFGEALPPQEREARVAKVFHNLNTPADYENWRESEGR
jgi:molybdopterin-guanine dinucleotide biosynthesis protein A